MTPRDLDKLVEKYLEGRCSEEERDLIETWYAALGPKDETLFPPDFSRQMAEAEARALEKLGAHSGGREVPLPLTNAGSASSHFWRYAGIAASIVLVVSAAFYWLSPREKQISVLEEAEVVSSPFSIVKNTTDLTRRVILPDGSIVQMSPRSEVRFSSDTKAPMRELYLEGEAYFDVAHDPTRPFFVYAGNIVTRVLGTSFTVRAVGTDEKVTISVKTGKVTVYTMNASHKKTVLVPNQEAIYDQRTDVMATQTMARRATVEKMTTSEMRFEETPVSEVLSMLMKAYDIDIVFQEEALAGCVLTSSFFEEGLYDRIDVICTAIGATYKIVDAQIVIESEGCNTKPK